MLNMRSYGWKPKNRHQNQLFLPLFDSDSFGLYFEEKWLGLLEVKLVARGNSTRARG